MLIKIKDKKTGTIYTNDMGADNKNCILEIHFCTSYTQVKVQSEKESHGKTIFPTHDIMLSPVKSKANFVDLIAIQNDNEGEWL